MERAPNISELCHVDAPQTSFGPHSPSHHLQLPCTACSRHFSSFWNAPRHFFMIKEFFFFLSFFLSSANIQRGTGGALASLSWRSSRLFLGEQGVQQKMRWGFQHVPTPFFCGISSNLRPNQNGGPGLTPLPQELFWKPGSPLVNWTHSNRH